MGEMETFPGQVTVGKEKDALEVAGGWETVPAQCWRTCQS